MITEVVFLSQQNIYPSSPSESAQIENKIILLYLIDKMDIPLSNSQITQFAIEENYMNYYSVQQYLSEMVDAGYLDKSRDYNTTRYTITDEGSQTLEFFLKNVPQNTKNRILKYVSENRKVVKQDFEIIANHFYDHKNNEYIVKCGVYDDEMMLLEMNLSVVSKEQALNICNNWKSNIDILYGQLMDLLLMKEQLKKNRGE
jgi:predicted transcriptional regulator